MFFFFNDTATTESYTYCHTLSLHDALPICADWFERADLKAKFKEKYGYELGVPVNWSAYEDIAKFFTEDVKEIDGKRVYGHMDYGKKDPSQIGRAHV